jgi:hypothetical protein
MARIRAAHPGYEICWAGTHWEALARPTATSVHVLAAQTLPRLEAQLDALAELPPAVRVARADAVTAAVDAILAQRYAPYLQVADYLRAEIKAAESARACRPPCSYPPTPGRAWPRSSARLPSSTMKG